MTVFQAKWRWCPEPTHSLQKELTVIRFPPCVPLYQMAILFLWAIVQFSVNQIGLARLPEPAANAVEATIPGGARLRVKSEVQDGEKVFEVSVRRQDEVYDVTVSRDGKILEIEKRILPRQLPKLIADAAKIRHPHSSVFKAEEVSRENQVTGYELVMVTKEGRIVKAAFTRDGAMIGERVQ